MGQPGLYKDHMMLLDFEFTEATGNVVSTGATSPLPTCSLKTIPHRT